MDVAGYVELSRNTTSAIKTPVSALTRWPNQNFPVQGDPPLIAPYYSQFMVRGYEPTGRMYWRRLDVKEHANDEGKEEITEYMLEWVSTEVRSTVLGAEDFEAKHALIVTWHDLTFSGCTEAESQCPVSYS